MTAPPVRLIAIDIDGTLLDSRSNLPKRNRRAVRAAVARGVHVVLATGRAHHHALPIARQLYGDSAAKTGRARPQAHPAPPAADGGPPACDGTIIVSNGALTKGTDGATLASRFLPREVACAVVAALRPLHRGVAAIFDRADARQYVHEGIDWSHSNRKWYYERNRKHMTESKDILRDLMADDPVQVGYTGSVAAMRALREALRGLPVADRLKPFLTEYAHRDFSLLDILARGSSKGTALAHWSRRLGLDAAEVMAVGDNLNDLEMLEFAGRPVVMGNAVAELKARGWPLTATHDECGLAEVVDAVAAPPDV